MSLDTQLYVYIPNSSARIENPSDAVWVLGNIKALCLSGVYEFLTLGDRDLGWSLNDSYRKSFALIYSGIMDVESPSKEVSADRTRELLISISNSLPEKDPNQDDVNLPFNGQDGAPVANGESNDEYRSELISISYTQSPDFASSPPVDLGCPKP